MIDTNTFLTTIYVMADDFCQSYAPLQKQLASQPGVRAALSAAEVITLGLFSQWQRFRSERDFYRFATSQLKDAFPKLPHRTQFNRQFRRLYDVLIAFFHYHLATLQQWGSYDWRCEVLDLTAVATRCAQRRGNGWMPGQARRGWSSRLKWFEGFHLLSAVNPQGIITGFGLSGGNTKEVHMAHALLEARWYQYPRLECAGNPAAGFYITDNGFEGKHWHRQWYHEFGAAVLALPKSSNRIQWSRPWRRWMVHIRQIIESVHEKLHHTFGLERERPHTISGLMTRVAARICLHNICIGINIVRDREPMRFADLLEWKS